MVDHYQILGITRGATKQEVKEAFRRLAVKYHPDKHTHSAEHVRQNATVRFKLVAEAYDVLNDDLKRASYNAGSDSDCYRRTTGGTGGSYSNNPHGNTTGGSYSNNPYGNCRGGGGGGAYGYGHGYSPRNGHGYSPRNSGYGHGYSPSNSQGWSFSRGFDLKFRFLTKKPFLTNVALGALYLAAAAGAVVSTSGETRRKPFKEFWEMIEKAKARRDQKSFEFWEMIEKAKAHQKSFVEFWIMIEKAKARRDQKSFEEFWEMIEKAKARRDERRKR